MVDAICLTPQTDSCVIDPSPKVLREKTNTPLSLLGVGIGECMEDVVCKRAQDIPSRAI
jgi:hypothetical protein